MINSLFQYTRSFTVCAADQRLRAVCRAHARPLRVGAPGELLPVNDALSAVADHLVRAQDHGPDDGLGSYHLVHGWSASYPETTGYIVPTMLSLAERLQRPELRERAVRAGDWLAGIQHPGGGWPGGRVGEDRPPVVFNTAQVVRGMLALHDATGDDRYVTAAVRACNWIVDVQESDGSWARHNFLGERRVYDAYVSAPLLHMAVRTNEERFRMAALRNLEWVMSRRAPNGWYADADNTLKHNDRPITHTIAYTLDGLIESHLRTGDPRLLEAASGAATALLEHFMERGSLHGRYDREWQGSEAAITTGSAQMAIVWARLHAITGDVRMREAGQRMVRWLVAVQSLSAMGPGQMHGAVTGSFPLWGRYEKFACPNWAQKYLADALLCTEGHLPRY